MAINKKPLSDGAAKRVEKALSRVGLSADMFPSVTVDALEDASIRFEAANLEADKAHYRAEVLRLAAVLLA